MQPIHRVDLKNRETEISRQIGPDFLARAKKSLFFLFFQQFSQRRQLPATAIDVFVIASIFFFPLSPLPSPRMISPQDETRAAKNFHP